MPPSQAPHLHTAEAVAQAHGVNPDAGLHPDEALRRSATHGANELAAGQDRPWWHLLADQFKDFMVLVLLGAAVISGLVGEVTDTLVILVIVVLNAVIGFVQAWRADQAMAALRQLAAAHATVLRSGAVQVVPATALVPGDIVLLEAGNQIPADLRLIEIAQLQVDESALTGESVTVAKQTEALAAEDVGALGDRTNMAFKGTTATHGRARGLVVATGMHTELGKEATLLDTGDRSTPLQLRLAAFGKRLAIAVLGICAVIFVVGVLRGEAPHQRMPSVETLGSVTTICSDQTGTLTQNRMHAELLLAHGVRWVPGDPLPGPAHAEALRAAALCNDATLQTKNEEGHSGTQWLGDPTETALVLAAHAGGLDKAQLDVSSPRVQEQPFDSDRKRMTTFHRAADGFVAYTKGAPESVLPRCTAHWTPEGAAALDTAQVLATAQQLAAQGLGRCPQHAVARRMAKAIVDVLEVVQVQLRDGATHWQLRRQHGHEPAAVADAGERVRLGHLLQPHLGPLVGQGRHHERYAEVAEHLRVERTGKPQRAGGVRGDEKQLQCKQAGTN